MWFLNGSEGHLGLVHLPVFAIKGDFFPRPKPFHDGDGLFESAHPVPAVGAESLKEMGAVMAKLREDFAGQMDFGKASAIVKQRLG